jgi:hypothetical protein
MRAKLVKELVGVRPRSGLLGLEPRINLRNRAPLPSVTAFPHVDSRGVGLAPRASAPAIGPVILIIFLAFVNLFLQFLDPAWPEPLTLAPFASETARLGWSAEGPFSFLSSVERSGVALGDKALQCGFTLASQPSAHSRPDFHWRRKFAAGDASVERCWINWSRAAE